ncbi:MAG: hypothetical protein AAGG75_22095 [Bacteroidota bacterium]
MRRSVFIFLVFAPLVLFSQVTTIADELIVSGNSIKGVDTSATLNSASQLTVPSTKAVRHYIDGIGVGGDGNGLYSGSGSLIQNATIQTNGNNLDWVTFCGGETVVPLPLPDSTVSFVVGRIYKVTVEVVGATTDKLHIAGNWIKLSGTGMAEYFIVARSSVGVALVDQSGDVDNLRVCLLENNNFTIETNLDVKGRVSVRHIDFPNGQGVKIGFGASELDGYNPWGKFGYTTVVGQYCGRFNKGGLIAFGPYAGYSQNINGASVMMGPWAGYRNISGHKTVFGWRALQEDTSSHSAAFGDHALRRYNGIEASDAFGYYAADEHRDGPSTFIGHQAGRFSQMGVKTLFGHKANINGVKFHGVAIGHFSLLNADSTGGVGIGNNVGSVPGKPFFIKESDFVAFGDSIHKSTTADTFHNFVVIGPKSIIDGSNKAVIGNSLFKEHQIFGALSFGNSFPIDGSEVADNTLFLGTDGRLYTKTSFGGIMGLGSPFLTNGTTAYYNGERVGIGTDSPARSLHVADDGFTSFRVDNQLDNVIFEMSAFSNAVRLTGFGNYPLHFRTQNLDRMTITGDGRVGIGIVNPGALLQVYENSSDPLGARIQCAGAGSAKLHYKVPTKDANTGLTSIGTYALDFSTGLSSANSTFEVQHITGRFAQFGLNQSPKPNVTLSAKNRDVSHKYAVFEASDGSTGIELSERSDGNNALQINDDQGINTINFGSNEASFVDTDEAFSIGRVTGGVGKFRVLGLSGNAILAHFESQAAIGSFSTHNTITGNLGTDGHHWISNGNTLQIQNKEAADIEFQAGSGSVDVVIKESGDLKISGAVISSTLVLDALNDVKIVAGSGDPEGSVSAGRSSVYHRYDPGAPALIYHKTTDTGNTGWEAQ